MAITLNRKPRFTHSDFSYSGTNYTEYLFGSVGLKVNADIRVEVAWSTENVNLRFLAADSTIERLDGGLSDFIADGWRVGDTIEISGTASNDQTTVITELTESIITVGAALVDETVVADLFGMTPISSMDFYPNLVSNNTELDLFNLTDRETMPKYYADSISVDAGNPTIMKVGTNSKGWVTPADAATVYRSSFTNHIQTFIISHTFTIAPLFLADQLENLQNGVPPTAGSFRDADCLKYIYQIDGRYSAFDPDVAHTTNGNVTFNKGNTGWYNEFINGRATTYTKQSILYTDASNGAGLSTIDYCKEVDVEARINAGATFNLAGGICVGGPNDGLACTIDADCPGGVCSLNAATKFILHVLYLPLNEDRYINTATDYKTNFIYERAVVTSGAAAVQGENTGDYHFLKDVTATIINVNEAKINFTTEFSDTLIDFFDCLDDANRNFLIFVTVQDPDTTSITSIDQSAIILDVNEYVCDKEDSTLFQIIDEVQFFEYPHCNGVGYSNFTLFPRDTIVAKAQFHVKQGTTDDPIVLKNISANIVAVKQNEVQEFPLESFNISTGGFLPNCDNIQEIDFTQDRDFILPATDCRNKIQLFRMPTLDIAGYSAYELIYPFKVRWEGWRKLQGADQCFSTPTQNWRIYANTTGWSIKFSVKAEVEKGKGFNCNNTNTTFFEHIVWGTIKDPCDIPYSVEFNTFDSTGVNSFEEVIALDADTKVEATITGDFSGFTESQLYGILTLDAWGVGGVAYSQEIGTRIAVDDDGVWKGSGSSLVATLTKVSDNTVKIVAYIDYLYLPTDTDQFILSARIGEFRQAASSSGAVCLNEVEIINFTCGELQIIEVVDANTLIVAGQVVTDEERNVLIEEMTLTFVTATSWTVSAGFIEGKYILSGSVAGNIIKAPTHPYTDSNVGDTLQGDITGTLNTSITEINGIGDMQIGCTFFVS